MTTAIRRRRGTTAQHSTFIGLEGETTIDTDKEVVVVHDGTTQGGFPLMRENGSNSALALGSAATPSLKFTGDTNTGIYSPGADQVAISTNGTGRLFISSTGQIGIGGAPSGGNLNIIDPVPTIRLTDSDTSGYSHVLQSDTSLYLDADRGAAGTGALIVRTNGTNERLRITSAGLVGVNASNPDVFSRGDASILGIGSTGTAAVAINAASGNSAFLQLGANGSRIFQINATATETYLQNAGATPIVFSTSFTERMRLDSSGRLGVGTSSPTGTLTIYDGGNQLHIDAPTSSNSNILFRENASTRWIAGYVPSITAFRFSNGSTDVLALTNAGRVGIGTGSPSSYDFDGPTALAVANTAGSSTLTIASDASSLGQIAFADGTSSTARYRGLLKYNHLTDGLEIRTAATPAITIDSSQRVGIGTTTPARLLEVQNTNAATDGFARISSTNNGAFLEFAPAGSNTIRHYTVGSAVGGSLIFYDTTANSQRAAIDSSGRLLVGTSSARSNVFTIAPQIQYEGTAASAQRFVSVGYNQNDAAGPGIALFKTRGTVTGSNTSVADSDGLGQIRFCGADGTNVIQGASIGAEVDGTPGANDMPGRLVFSVTSDGASSPTERMRIQANGRILIGSTVDSGANQLQVTGPNSTNSHAGRFNSGNTTSNGINVFLSGTRSSDTTYTAFIGTDDNTTFFRVYGNGNTQNTNNSYAGTSDLKLKENIVDASSQWADIKALKVRKYNFKADSGFSTHTQIGLVAQEAELVSPGLVGQSPDFDFEGNDLGTVTKSVNYSVLYMKAVKALQEAMERIEQLEAKVAALESA